MKENESDRAGDTGHRRSSCNGPNERQYLPQIAQIEISVAELHQTRDEESLTCISEAEKDGAR